MVFNLIINHGHPNLNLCVYSYVCEYKDLKISKSDTTYLKVRINHNSFIQRNDTYL